MLIALHGNSNLTAASGPDMFRYLAPQSQFFFERNFPASLNVAGIPHPSPRAR
jgi:hypothetical protein